MKALTRLAGIFLFAICLAARAADATQDPATAAIAALEAMNNNQGAQFVALAHPDLKKQMRDSVMAQIVADANQGRVSREMAALGAKTPAEAEAVPADTVVRVTVERMRDHLNAAMRSRMRTAKFTVVNTTKEDENTRRLLISLELQTGDTPRTEPFEVRVRKHAGAWLFLGHPQMMPAAAK